MNHELWAEAAAAFALDSLDGEERPGFEEHLAACADCRQAVQEFRDVAALLARGAPQAAAPPSLRGRVADLVRADVAASSFAARTGTPGANNGGSTADPAIAGTIRPRRPSTLPWLAAAAAIVLAMMSGLLARQTARGVNDLEATIARLSGLVEGQDSVLRYLTGPEVHVVSLAAGEAKPVARVFWNHTENRFIVTAFDLPPATQGKVYQLWAISDGKAPVSMGTFTTDAQGDATVVLPVDPRIEDLGFIHVCALTEEAVGGVEAPTESPRLSGTWRHTD